MKAQCSSLRPQTLCAVEALPVLYIATAVSSPRMTVNHNPIYLSVMTDVTETVRNVVFYFTIPFCIRVVLPPVCCILPLFAGSLNYVTLY
jgi:hypothetical protein